MNPELLGLVEAGLDDFDADFTSFEAAVAAPAGPAEPEAPEPKERIFKNTAAYKALSKIGVVNEGGLIKKPTYIVARQYDSRGDITFETVYKIEYVSAYVVELIYVQYGEAQTSVNVNTNSSFWDETGFDRSTHAEWKKGR